MIIRVFKDAKDRQMGPKHKTYSRREFIERGLATTTMAAALPTVIATELTKQAFAATGTVCPVTSSIPGGIGQIHGPGGGCALSSYMMDDLGLAAATNTANTSLLNLWGITGGANAKQVFAHGGVDVTSPFGLALTTPPPGISATTWNAALKQCSFAANYGAAPQDDGGGDNLGHIIAVSPKRKTGLNTDLMINTQVTLAKWASGLGAIDKVAVGGNAVTAAKLAAGFGITPSAGTTGPIFSNTAAAASSLGSLFTSVMTQGRAGSAAALTAASCGFSGDAPLASSTFGLNLFTPANIPAISGAAGLQLGTLSAAEQAYLAAFYQSDIGQLGAVVTNNNGADYHNQNPITNIAVYDSNVGSQVRMWLLAAFIANKPAALIISTNGSPGPQGTQNGQITGVSGSASAQVTVNANVASGDDGGSFSMHGLLLFSPTGSTPPQMTSTGSFSTATGKTTPGSTITSVPQSVASLTFTAMQFLNKFNAGAADVAGLEAVMVASGNTPVSLL